MKTAKLKVGLVGTSQLSFPGNKAHVFGASVRALEKEAETLGFDLAVCPETVVTREDAVKAVRAMEEAHVDFLLLQNTSFSAGYLAPVFARIRGARLGIWAIPEGAEDGPVPFNSFCSLNMYQSIIAHYVGGIPVKWFFGAPESDLFRRRLAVTVRALSAIKSMSRSKIALIGGIAPGFNDLYDDERNLNRLFDGIEYDRLPEYDEIKSLALSFPDTEATPVAEKLLRGACGVHAQAKDLILLSAKFYLAYRRFAEKYGCDALAVSCWPRFQEDFRYSVCSVVAMLNGDGIPTACEGDTLSAASMLALKYLTGNDTILMDMSGFDESDDTVLMWHCGPAAPSYARDGKYTLGVNYTGLPQTGESVSCCGVALDMELRPGPATAMRLTGECDTYFLMEGSFIEARKKSFCGSRGWLGSLRLGGEAIGARDLVNSILVSGFQHHYPIVSGSCADEVREFAAWLGLKPVEKVPYADYLQRI